MLIVADETGCQIIDAKAKRKRLDEYIAEGIDADELYDLKWEFVEEALNEVDQYAAALGCSLDDYIAILTTELSFWSDKNADNLKRFSNSLEATQPTVIKKEMS